MKINWKPGTMIYPLPAVLISCGDAPENYNMFTVSWVGTACTNPAMCYISVRPSRHSYDLIKKSGEFVINLTTKDLVYAADYCGVKLCFDGAIGFRGTEADITRCARIFTLEESDTARINTHVVFAKDVLSGK